MKNTILVQYFAESWNELKKVTWPTRQQSVKLTFIVLGFLFGAAFVLAFFDFIFSRGFQYLLTIA